MNLPRAPYPLPLRERVAASAASGRVRGSLLRSPHPPRGFAARHPLPQGERGSECAAHSSFCLPSGSSVLVVLELDAHRLELVADAVGLLETFRLARGITCIDERVHLICIDDAAMRMIFERFAFCDFEHSKKTSRRLQFVLELQLMQS